MDISLAPLVNVWSSAIKAAEKDKDTFTRIGNICNDFFVGSADAMWGSDFRRKHLNSLPAPQFKITLNKTAELVQIFSPSLMWDAPGRTIEGYGKLDIPPEIIALTQGMSPDDPQFAEAIQRYQMATVEEEAIAQTRRVLMERYLNYTPREQPGGGLRFDSHLAIIDALIYGRGVIRVDTYTPPGTDDVFTGGFYTPVCDLFIDPDCTRGNLSNAKWIAIRHTQPHWEVERKFGWPEGSLKGKSTAETKQSAAANKYTPDGVFQRKSDTNDLCVWFEIFSKCGVGTRFKQKVLPQWHSAFERSVGDFAHLCIMKNMKEPLNLRSSFLEEADMEQVKMALSWPIPYETDNRWPVALLDFWHNTSSCWPLATVGLGLGELMFLNLFTASLAERVYRGNLSKIAVRQELVEDATAKLLSWQHEVVELNPVIAGNINELVSVLQMPSVTYDSFRMLDYVSMLFDKRVGLMELLYGLNPGGKVSRTASDANIKGEAVSVRPEYMASQVANWQTEIANLERIAAGDGVKGQSLVGLLGSTGSSLWTQLITQADPIAYVREMRSRVEASSMRRPNKRKENENMQQFGAFFLPMAQWYASSTGNTEPLNEFLKSMGDAMDQDVDGWLMPTIQQQGPSEEEVAMQQQAEQLQMAEKAEKLKGRAMQNARTAHEMFANGQGLSPELMEDIEEEPFMEEEA